MALNPIDDLVASQLGVDKVTNGDFSASGTWTYGQSGGAGWAYDGTGDEADCDGSQTAAVNLEQSISAVAAEIYLLQYTLSNWVVGTVTPQIGGADGLEREADGTYEDYITASNTGNLKFQADGDFNGTIDDVTVRRAFSFTVPTARLTWTNADTYEEIRIQYDKGAGWETWVSGLSGSTTTYDVVDIVPNISYNFRVFCLAMSNPIGDRRATSNTDSCAVWKSAPMASIALGGSVEESVLGTDYAETPTAEIAIGGYVLDAISLKTNYAYYLGDSSGKIYEYSGSYLGDAGATIPSRWESKDTDFSDQDLQISHRSKTIEKMRLHYIDKTEDAVISVSLSTDGGATWTPRTKTIGTGDGKAKHQDYYSVKSGHMFRFAIENASATDEFLMTGLEIFFTVGGD